MLNTRDDEVNAIAARSHAASLAWARLSREDRAISLRAVAGHLEAGAEQLVALAMGETRLPEARLAGELKRTTFQLRLFAETLEEGAYLDARIDHADPQWPMGPRPDLRRVRLALGPVVVFAASNFPFAFSVAGGDTASALAAGCAVIVKAHPGHPQLSAATAAIVSEALGSTAAPDGLFQIIYGESAGVSMLRHPLVKAGAFTGSISGGRALFDIAVSRSEPIPFYGEMGSVNPVFVTVAADADRGEQIAEELIGSFTLGTGQFCTKPGIVLVPADSSLLEALALRKLPSPVPMLNDRILEGYLQRQRNLREHPGVRILNAGDDGLADPPSPTILATSVTDLLANPTLLEECFGPTVVVAEYSSEEQLLAVAESLEGQLTATLIADPGDAIVPRLMSTLTSKAGRLLWNQWPTGVSVTHAQQHGGPYPATTASATTSVGTAAIDRFTRPVAFQGFPESFLPPELRDDSRIPRRVDGRPASTS